jgi:BirA family biotin operon repressor/biotin-[acetyl-CoA-carboxylase] ligase
LLRPHWPLARWPRLTMWAGVSVAAVLERFAGVPARIKWPNDVVVNGKKVAGILIESALDADGNGFAVAGIGINVNQPEFPEELAERAVSLRQLKGRLQDRAALAVEILRELESRLPEAPGGQALIAEAGRRSALLGTWVQLQAGTTSIEGTAEALDEEGNLLLRLADGTLYRATAGEVTSQVR